MKSLKDISLPITEEEYRNDGAMHYSTLASFSRGGFHSIPTLFDKKESPALLFGSIVDTLMTDGKDAFDDQYYVVDMPSCPDSIISIVKGLFEIYKDEYKSISEIPTRILIDITEQVKYQLNWKPETRAKVIKEKGAEYYKQMYLAKDKIIISSDIYSQAYKCVDALRTSPATKFLFAPNNPFDNVERLYQLKFTGTHNSIKYSCMADLIVVLHDKKKVIPCDLKTSSHFEDEFYESFIQWNYHIQARLYWRLIRAAMDADEYFKDFELEDYHFIVVNKNSLIPLVWKYPDTQKLGTLHYGKLGNIECRDPYDLGEELYNYQHNNGSVQNNVFIDRPNDIVTFLNSK